MSQRLVAFIVGQVKIGDDGYNNIISHLIQTKNNLLWIFCKTFV